MAPEPVGRVASRPGSHPSGHARFAVDGASRFDPSRGGALRYLDICSGISAPTMAWKPLGWEALCFAEIEAAPRAVLSRHYPDVPLRGDFTEIRGDEYGPVDLLVGGTPCQSFSVAGLRGGLADDRGNLALEFLRLADRARPRWLVWENVPGVLSIDEGRAFGSILGGMGELGYGLAYRVLDAQFFGVPQRRRRVFVVGYIGDWRRAAAVLFERHSLQGHPPPSRQEGERIAPTISARPTGGGGLGTDFDCDGGLVAFGGNNTAGPIETATAVNAHGGPHGRLDFESETFVAFNITPSNSNKDFNARQSERAQALTAGGNRPSARGGDLVCFSAKDHGADAGDISPTLRAGGHSGSHANAGVMPAVAFAQNNTHAVETDVAATLTKCGVSGEKGGQGAETIIGGSAVRRLTPRECERLQGFPDDFTLVPYRKGMMADGPRYKMLGNSMAVPVVRWIGERIATVEALAQAERAAA